jgi:IclR family KDG regulon transcriptional repressor
MTTESDLPGKIAQLRHFDDQADVTNLLPEDKRKPAVYKSVYRTANILKCVSNGVNSVTDIANLCNLDKSTVYRLLKTLNESGLILQDPITHQYFIGPLITEIASNPYVTHENLISCALNEMKRLSNLTGESIGLHVLIGIRCVILHEIPSIYDFAISAKKKIIEHLHAGANTRVLLSQLNSKELKIAMANMVLEPLTELTITDKEQLLALLKQIKRQGYAISYGERITGGINIAVPIKNYPLTASLSILGPESRIRPKTAEFLRELIASGKQVEQNLKQVFNIE